MAQPPKPPDLQTPSPPQDPAIEEHPSRATTRRGAVAPPLSVLERIVLGAVGAVLPIVLNVLVVDLELTFKAVTWPLVFGFAARVIVLIGLGSLVGYANKDETSSWRLLQLGVAAPALLVAAVNGQERVKIRTGSLLTPAYASEAMIAQSDRQGSWDQFLRGVWGRAPEKKIEMEPVVLRRGSWEFGPLNAIARIEHDGESEARINVTYSIAVGNQGRVYQRSGRYGDTNGPWLHLDLLDSRGSVVLRRPQFIAPTWECRIVSSGSREDTILLSKGRFFEVASFRLVDSGGGWREEGCR